jgi:propionyl-CoA synthetase
MAEAQPVGVRVAATDPLYILAPRHRQAQGVVRDNRGHAVALRWAWAYDTGPGEVFWAASDVGWVVGHSSSFTPRCWPGARPCCMRGSRWAPDAGAFWRVIAEHRVKALFTAPTAFRAVEGRPERQLTSSTTCRLPLPVLVASGSTRRPTGGRGERNVPVIDHWWQTGPAGRSPPT